MQVRGPAFNPSLLLLLYDLHLSSTAMSESEYESGQYISRVLERDSWGRSTREEEGMRQIRRFGWALSFLADWKLIV